MVPFFDISLIELAETVGYVGIFTIVVVESGIPIGFFLPLPGDTLLFTVGLLASQGVFNIVTLIVIIVTAAILGDSAGYWFGKKFGPRLFTKEDARIFNKKNLELTEEFYKKYGMGAIILARFVPVVRTLAPIFAGVGSMPYSTFIRYNVVGALLWGMGVTLAGYFLGGLVPDVDKYLIPIVLIFGFVTFLPVLRGVLKFRSRK